MGWIWCLLRGHRWKSVVHLRFQIIGCHCTRCGETRILEKADPLVVIISDRHGRIRRRRRCARMPRAWVVSK